MFPIIGRYDGMLYLSVNGRIYRYHAADNRWDKTQLTEISSSSLSSSSSSSSLIPSSSSSLLSSSSSSSSLSSSSSVVPEAALLMFLFQPVSEAAQQLGFLLQPEAPEPSSSSCVPVFGNDEYTVLLQHFDGNANDSSNPDYCAPSAYNGTHSVTTHSAPTYSAVGGLGGAFDQYISFDGNDDYLEIDHDADWNFGAGDFTIDGWVRFDTAIGQKEHIVNHDEDGGAGWQFSAVVGSGAGDQLRFDYDSGSGFYTSAANLGKGFFSTGVWYHVVVTRSSGSIRFFVDGIQKSVQAGAWNITGTSQLFIGKHEEGATDKFFQGDMDELRISKGIARWTSSFIVPCEPYDFPCVLSSSSSSSSSSSLSG